MPSLGAYLRISEDPDDERTGVTRQRQDCTAEAARRGWGEVQRWFEDNDRSAWRKSVTRHAWQAMLKEIDAGTLDRVVVYDLDRLVRQPRDLEDLIDLADAGKVQVAGVSAEIDLTTDAGITQTRVLTAFAWKTSADTARRVRRQKQQRAEEGRGPGSRFRTFGYTRGFEIIEDEAATVRDLFARAAAGESLQAITNSLNERGILTTAGGPWRRTTLTALLRRPGYSGIATWKGEVIGGTAYPAIVTEPEYAAAQRDNRDAGFNARVYLLSGIAVCDLCKAPLYGTARGRYACKPGRPGSCGKVTMKAQWLDAAIIFAIPFYQEALEAEPDEDYEAQVAVIDARIGDLRAAHTAGDLELADMLPLLRAERDRRGTLVRRQAAETGDRRALAAAGRSLEDYFASSVSARRAVVRRHFQAVIVRPTTAAGRRQFDPARLQLLRSDGRLTEYGDLMPELSPAMFAAIANTYALVEQVGVDVLRQIEAMRPPAP